MRKMYVATYWWSDWRFQIFEKSSRSTLSTIKINQTGTEPHQGIFSK